MSRAKPANAGSAGYRVTGTMGPTGGIGAGARWVPAEDKIQACLLLRAVSAGRGGALPRRTSLPPLVR